ncbi:MAG: signal recognition particle protein [Planctomycetota bacterium]|nr:MAG: signal recognition particle protein [Planctomycetota bacterium]
MFEGIAERFTGIFEKLRWGGKLTEENIREGLREVRRALLEADVNVQVVREFLDRVTEQAVGEEVLSGVQPGQQVVRIVHDELVALMGEADADIPWAKTGPTIILMAGLQGSGKTTTCAKLARLLKENGKRPLLVAADLQRPAAIDQLRILGEQISVPVFHEPGLTPPEVCAKALKTAEADGRDVVILDTAGRLHVDDALMAEVAEVHRRTSPHQTYLVVDSMTGQDAVNSAKAFHERLPLSGVIFTKLDGDTRGGAIVSLRHLIGVPIKFVGVGEKTDALQPFYPDRYARRILGMGDVLSFVEKAQSVIDEDKAKELEEKFAKNKFDLGDFATQLEAIQKMGSIKDLLGMIPGVGAKFKALNVDESIFKRYMSIISSMTQYEKQHPDLIDMSRRRRIANGSGSSTADVQQLLKQFSTMRKMIGKFGDMQDMVGRLPENEEELTPDQLANPQSFMPNPNRLFATREDKKKQREAKQARKKKAKMKKKSKR